MMTDAKRVENLVGLSEVKSSTSELSTAAEIRDVPQRYGESYRVSVRASPLTSTELQGGKLHGRHSVSAQGSTCRW